MAVIKYPLDSDARSLGITGECSICGRRSSAYWMCRGVEIFEVCSTCAAEKLPLLVAESLDDNIDRFRAESVLRTVAASFWRDMSLCLMNRPSIRKHLARTNN